MSRYLGVLPAIAILAAWGFLLVYLLGLDPSAPGWGWHLLAVPVVAFLYTGLFITAHDAMHGALAPGSRRLNDGLGALCLALYALFSFRRVREAHQRHHAGPAIAGDPDWHDGRHAGAVRWYLTFMRRYLTWRQLAGMALAYQAMARGLHVPHADLLAFWVAPSLLSTVQLFYFGTYRVHREPPGGHADHHRATSLRCPLWLSFLACYNFGMHWEHHAHPHLPWWRLPGRNSCCPAPGRGSR